MTVARATETAVVVPVPAAEPVVAGHRRRLDVAASWGVGAHVSVLYPFAPPSVVDDALIARLDAALRGCPPSTAPSNAASGSATTCCGWRPSRLSRSAP